MNVYFLRRATTTTNREAQCRLWQILFSLRCCCYWYCFRLGVCVCVRVCIVIVHAFGFAAEFLIRRRSAAHAHQPNDDENRVSWISISQFHLRLSSIRMNEISRLIWWIPWFRIYLRFNADEEKLICREIILNSPSACAVVVQRIEKMAPELWQCTNAPTLTSGQYEYHISYNCSMNYEPLCGVAPSLSLSPFSVNWRWWNAMDMHAIRGFLFFI